MFVCCLSVMLQDWLAVRLRGHTLNKYCVVVYRLILIFDIAVENYKNSKNWQKKFMRTTSYR